jgi:hypothetical protein
VIGCRKLIKNESPIIGVYNVNASGSGDMYPKGGNMLHTIRQVVDDDEKWRQILRGLNHTFYHQTVQGAQVEQYVSRQAGRDLQKVFDQYLRNTQIPALEYRLRKGRLEYRWTNCVPGFDLPIRVKSEASAAYTWLYPTTSWQIMPAGAGSSLTVDPNFYVTSREAGQK